MQAREFLSRHGVGYRSHLVDAEPIPRAETLEIVSRATRLLIKVGQDILRFDAREHPMTQAQAETYLVHDDGFLRVPVLVLDDLLVRGYTDELYREALAEAPERGAAG